MRIGYSFWGFLGPGITDTPDGGRSHRATLTEGLIGAGHQLVFLQANRDLNEADLDLCHRYTWNLGLPDIDVLFLEWRWPIPGRNTGPCSAPGHTCDLHRQQALVDHYTIAAEVPTVLWDKDRRLPADDPLRRRRNVAVCEPALRPGPGAATLLFPVHDDALDTADPVALAVRERPLPLVYVGNQYDRDDAFDAFFAPAAAQFPHRVAGKWTAVDAWPHVHFAGRCPFTEVERLYSSSLATILLLPRRYAAAGQMTQRLFEAVLAGCLPITPGHIAEMHRFTPPWLHVADGQAVVLLLQRLSAIAGGGEHARLLAACLKALDLFRLSRQLAALHDVLAALTNNSADTAGARPPAAAR